MWGRFFFHIVAFSAIADQTRAETMVVIPSDSKIAENSTGSHIGPPPKGKLIKPMEVGPKFIPGLKPLLHERTRQSRRLDTKSIHLTPVQSQMLFGVNNPSRRSLVDNLPARMPLKVPFNNIKVKAFTRYQELFPAKRNMQNSIDSMNSMRKVSKDRHNSQTASTYRKSMLGLDKDWIGGSIWAKFWGMFGWNPVEPNPPYRRSLLGRWLRYQPWWEETTDEVVEDETEADRRLNDLFVEFKNCYNGEAMDEIRTKLALSKEGSPAFKKLKKVEKKNLKKCIDILHERLLTLGIDSAKLGEKNGLILNNPLESQKVEMRHTKKRNRAMIGSVNKERDRPRNVGGIDAPDGKYPYMVSLRLKDENRHICGGTLLNNHWILTVAHCFTLSPMRSIDAESMIAVVGTNRLDEGGDVYRVESHVEHPNYTDDRNNDIALVRVKEDIVFGHKVRPIKLPTQDITESARPVVLVGWERNFYTGNVSNTLQHLKLKLIPTKLCAKIYPEINGVSIICTLTKSEGGFCKGDPGEPLVADGVQIGIVSGRFYCGYGLPDMYIHVWKFINWINENIGQK